MELYQTGSQIFPLSETRIIEELGIAIEPIKSYHFFDDFTSTPFIRSYAEPCGTLTQEPPTKFCNGSSLYYRMQNLKALHENCNERWNETILELHEFANPPTDSARTRRGAIAVVSTFVKTIGALLNTMTFLADLVLPKLLYKKGSNLVNAKFVSGSMHMRTFDSETLANDQWQKFRCEFETQNLANYQAIQADNVLSKFQEKVASESIQLAIGEIPDSLDLVESFILVCKQVPGNTVKFCTEALLRKTLTFDFQGLHLELDQQALYNALILRIPKRSRIFEQSVSYRITNLGTWDELGNYIRVDLPDTIIQSKTGNFYALDSSHCQSTMCPVNAASVSVASECLKSLLSSAPSLEKCKVEKLASPEGCAITTMRSGTLVRSPKGLFLSEGHGNGPLSVKFGNETKFLNQSGRLYCGDTSDDSEIGQTYVIRGPSQSPAMSIKNIEKPKILDLALNLTDLSTALSQELKVETRISELENDMRPFSEIGVTLPIVLVSQLGLILISISIYHFSSVLVSKIRNVKSYILNPCPPAPPALPMYISTGSLEPKSPQTNKDESDDAQRAYPILPPSSLANTEI
uniref:Envelope protein n=1 Tax=Oikopleura dioica TaxID=34765 RepID=Q6GV75_OIKDI|nr:envelope protein [Oikopleura dioica]